MTLPDGRIIHLTNIPRAGGRAVLHGDALNMMRSGMDIEEIAREWGTSDSGAALATIVTYIADALRVHAYTDDEIMELLRACGIDSVHDVRPVLERIEATGDCRMGDIRASVLSSGCFDGIPNTAMQYNVIRICIVDTIRQQVLWRAVM